MPRPALTKAIVALGIHFLCPGDIRQVLFALSHVLAAFQHDGAQAQLDESERREETTGAFSYHDHPRLVAHVRIMGGSVSVILRYLIDIYPYGEIHDDVALTGINTSFEHPRLMDGAHVDALLLGDISDDILRGMGHLRSNTYLKFLYHNTIRSYFFAKLIKS